jgi:hypothetical protein
MAAAGERATWSQGACPGHAWPLWPVHETREKVLGTLAVGWEVLVPAAWIARHPEARVKPLNVRHVTDFADR